MKIKSSKESIKALMKLKTILNIEFINIFEFGSRYGEDSIELAKLNLESSIYSFECNPKTVDECQKAVEKYSNIFFTNSAIGNVDGDIDFYPIDEKNTVSEWPDGNQGASSLLMAKSNSNIGEKYVQHKVTVPIMKLSSFLRQKSISEISLLWMDIQGAEKMALEGLEERIYDVKLIHLEVEFSEIYKDQPLFKEIHKFLKEKQFVLIGFTNINKTAGDAVYLNSKNRKGLLLARIYLFFIAIKNKFIGLISK